MLFGLAVRNPHERIFLMISAALGSHCKSGHAVIGMFKSKEKKKSWGGRSGREKYSRLEAIRSF